MAKIVLLHAVLMLLLPVSHSVKFNPEDNGYDIVVAINKNVAENVTILTQLQTAFTSASKYLHQTTRKYFYFSHVTILVPETWTTHPDWIVSDLTFKEADLRVDSPHPAMANNPYTFQPELCGDAGRYIHLTQDFVLDNGINRDFYYGDFGRLLVHEFAHLRFGVFDEYGSRESSQHPAYYLDGSTLRPTACSHEIGGSFVDTKADLLCTPDDDKNTLANECDFIVDTFTNTATSSVMFAQFLEEVVDFCETDTTDPKLRHNADAPNKHNKMCNGRGTWDIIREHDDVIYSSPNIGQDTTPTFQVVQGQMQKVDGTNVCGRRFVFVLDLSGSMGSNNRYFKLRQMADKIIRDILPVGTEVGIVVFNSSASVWAEMRHLKTGSDKDILADSLPTQSDFRGGTAIGKGLRKGIALLKENGHTAEEGRLFLITDGAENVNPRVSSILSEIVGNNTVVHTLAYTDAAAEVLRELSTQTGGQYSYFDESSENSTELDGAAQRLLEDVSICESGDDSIEIDRHATVLDSTKTSYERTVLIDSTVGNDTLFVFTLSPDAETQVSIRDPSGKDYNENSTHYELDETLNIVRFRFALAEDGEWSYALQKGSHSEESVVGVVKSHPRAPETLPFKVESWLGKTTYDIGNDKEGLVVYSYVHQGYAPVINASVKVTVSGGAEKELLDYGILPDTTAEDGVYSNYVVGFTSKSRYSLVVTVRSIEGQTMVMKSGNLLDGRALIVYPNLLIKEIGESGLRPVFCEDLRDYPKEETSILRTKTVPFYHGDNYHNIRHTLLSMKPVEPFNRISSAGALDIKGFDETLDQFDPSRVTDLAAIISDRGSRHVTLTWTAPGDDLNEGTVSRYDIRVAKKFEDLRNNFTDSYEILESDIKEGSSTPVPAGSKQNMTLSLSGQLDSEQFVFGLKAIDDSNRRSDLSNLQAVTFEKIILPVYQTTRSTTEEPTTATKEPTTTTSQEQATTTDKLTTKTPEETTTTTSEEQATTTDKLTTTTPEETTTTTSQEQATTTDKLTTTTPEETTTTTSEEQATTTDKLTTTTPEETTTTTSEEQATTTDKLTTTTPEETTTTTTHKPATTEETTTTEEPTTATEELITTTTEEPTTTTPEETTTTTEDTINTATEETIKTTEETTTTTTEETTTTTTEEPTTTTTQAPATTTGEPTITTTEETTTKVTDGPTTTIQGQAAATTTREPSTTTSSVESAGNPKQVVINKTGMFVTITLAGIVLGIVVATVICLFFIKRRGNKRPTRQLLL